MNWEYEVGDRRKHKERWNRRDPGFVRGPGGELIGKCPHHLSIDECQRLINEGIEYQPLGWTKDYPQQIYVIFEGHLYRAMPTNPGRSYHGFPEHSSRARQLPVKLKNQILERAAERGCRAEIERWLNGG